MIFNRDNSGSKEVRELTGNYYANNDFGKITTDIELATEEVSGLIGTELYKKVEDWYKEKEKDVDQDLIKKVQRPIAILATLRMYQKNDLSHEDDGRKFKIATDNSEKLPWEWQLDRDDARHMEDYYKAVDALIRYLNTSQMKEWTESRTYKMSQLLLLRSGADFDIYFPIDKSERTFMLLLPFIKEAQLLYVKKAYGNGWADLLKTDESNEAYFAACKAVALLAMSIALRRMQLKIIPAGVIRGYVSASGAMNSEPASMEDIKLLSEWMNDDAMIWIDEMKKARDGGTVTYNLLPENDKHNKYIRL